MAKKGKLKKPATKNIIERPVRERHYQYLFLIVCEDEKTEPSYFETYKSQIPEKTIFLETVGTGKDPKGVVEAAIEKRNNLFVRAKKEVDEVWAVFDKDDADKYPSRIERFENAFEIAESEGIKVAYSNEVFELWLLLHLTDVDSKTPLPRNEIYQLLQDNIRRTPKYNTYVYNHHRPNPQTVKIILEVGNLETAIQRAELLLEKQKERRPIEANPSTRVHILIQELLNWIEYYKFSPSKAKTK
jgi:hypothetical protein